MHPIRQGDVYLEPVSTLPANLKPVDRDHARVILAYGEVTGHAHAIHDGGCALLEAEDGQRFLRVDDVELVMEPRGVIDRELRDIELADGTIVRFTPEQFAEAKTAIRDSGRLTTRGVLLKHEEHAAVVVEPGDFALPGQREYVAPEIERRVAD
ncbi:MAG: hypothetical protein ACREML_00115 [Vulcanimicrobiaceae bacterium]